MEKTKDEIIEEEIKKIIDFYEDDFNYDGIADKFLNLIIMEKSQARKEVIEEEIEFLNSLQWCKRNKKDSSLLITLNNKISHQIIQLKNQLKEGDNNGKD